MVRKGVVFDVDGTLVDTNYLHTVAWWRALLEVGELVPMSEIHRVVGMTSEPLVEALIGSPRPAVIEGHSRHFDELSPQVEAFPQAGTLLDAVHHRGATVVLATSAKEKDVADLVAAIGASEGCIDHVVHSGHVRHGKPGPDLFQAALEVAGLERDRTLVVGDTVWDVEAASRCGLACLAVLTGGIGRAELEQAGALAVYRDVGELLLKLGAGPLGELLDA